MTCDLDKIKLESNEDASTDLDAYFDSDHHSGWHEIAENKNVTIAEDRTMTIDGLFVVHGFLIQNGYLKMT